MAYGKNKIGARIENFAPWIQVLAARMLLIVAAVFTLGASWPSTSVAQPASPPVATSSLIVKLAPGLSASEQVAVVTRNGGVQTASVPALRLHTIQVDVDQLDATAANYRADSQVLRVELNNVRQSNAIPSDPLYSQQWALPKIGWDLVFGNSNPGGTVVVAVLDTGIDATHPDLTANLVAGTSILDGSNGFTDPSGHGTMVAGAVAARTNSMPAEGIAGVAYAGVRLMPVTVLDADGLGQDSDVIEGVIWAADHGAHVIVMAFSNPGFSDSLQEAIDYAWSKNVVLVAATGNDGLGTPTYPAGDRGVIGVSATDENDALASFSNYGPSVFLAAPGTNILTTDIGSSYIAISGTSTSAALVAGAAAQMLAIDPALTNGVVVGRLARTADPAGTQEETGNGRINLARALLDTGTDFLQPAGAAPMGSGGPFVGPYTAAATNVATNTSLNAISTPLSSAQAGVPFSGVVSRQNSSEPAIPAGGSVELQFRSGTACNGSLTTTATATINAAGSFSGNFTAPTAAGTYGYQAQYQGASQGSGGSAINWQKSASACQTITVNAQAATSTSINAPTITYNASGSVTVTVTSTAGTVTGNVSLSVDGGAAASKALASGSATFTSTDIAALSSPGAGNHALSASYAAQGSFAASSASGTLHVNQASSTTTVSCPASVPYSGAAQAPCSVTVTSVGLSLTPSPNYSNNTNAGTATASYTYAGDANHLGSGDSKNFTISQASSTTTVTCPASVPYTGAAQTPCTATANGAGGVSQSLTVGYSNNTNAGTATASATFAGDTNHTGSSDSKTFTIDKANSAMSVSSSNNPATSDEDVSFTASVTPGATGNVQFLVNGSNYGAQVALAGGTATIAFTNKTAGTYTVTASYLGDPNYNGSSGNLSPDQQVTSGTPAKLAFDVQPTDTQAGQAIAPAVTVRILDAAGNLTASIADVTVATGLPDAFTASSTTTVAAVAGVATFADLHINKAGTYTIGAASTGMTVATSNSFNVTPGVAVTFGFNVPASIPAGQSFDITVTAKDQFNNTATGYTGVVHFTSSDPHATLPADTMFTAPDNGVKTIVGGTQLKTAGNQTITATDTVATSPTITGTSATIAVNPGNATVLVVTAPAATETAGTPFDVTVEAQDAYGNTAIAYAGSVHFDITDPRAEILGDYSFVPATDHGVHTFSVTLHSAGQFTVKATDTSGFNGESGTITVQPGPPAKLAFKMQPGNTFVGVAIPNFEVAVLDADDNLVDNGNGDLDIAIAIGTNPTGVAVLNGTVTHTAVNGVATFSGLMLNKAANGYTLVTSRAPLTAATSDPFNVGKGTATLTLGNLHHTYDGSPKSAAVTTTPAGLSGVSITYDGSTTGPTNAGSYAAVASLANDDYEATNATGTLVIDKAVSTTTMTCPASITFDGTAQTPCTAKVTGAGSLDKSLPVSYANNTNAGTATANATFAGDANHDGSSDSKTFTIEKALSTTSISCPTSATYSGAAQTPCTANVTGAGGLNQSLTVNYTNNINAGTASASAAYAGDANHQASNDSKTFTIEKAASTTSISCPASVTYTGSEHTPCTANVTGAGGLNQSLTVSHTNNTNAGMATASASYAGDANHESSSDSKTFAIAKAPSSMALSCPASVTYSGAALTPCTANVTGAGSLNQLVPMSYTNNTNAGTATASANYAGDPNHESSSNSKTFTIAKAASTTALSCPASVTYSGAAQTPCTANVTGTGGLNQLLMVSYTSNINAGTATTNASYAGDANHEPSSDAKAFTIAKATSATSLSCPTSPTYNGAAQTPCTANVTGAGGLNQSLTVSYANNTNAGTATASATYAGDTNHESSGDSKTFYIAKAASSTVVSVPGGQAFAYDGLEHPAAVSVTGAGGLVWAPSPVYGCGHVPKDVADSVCIASYTYAGDANHNGSSGSITYAIAKAPSITTVLAANVFYDGNQHGATAATTGAGALNLSLVVTYSGVSGTAYGPSPTMPKEMGTYQAAASFVGDANHTASAGTTTFSIVGVTVTGPGGPLAKGTTASLVVSIPNTGMNTAPKCSVDWDDGTSTPPTTMTLNSGQGACTLPKPYPAAGVYSPVVRVDADLNNAGTTTSITTVYQFVVIYDTSAGFVTGGGWIISPPGAYVGNPALTGKANFGFVSKYQKGANVPTGDTEFQFQAGGFNFKSTVYEWLVISGSKAQYKGSGTVNGSDDYGFLLTATDGKLKGDGIDKLRIKVWSKSTGDVVYDNKPGSDDIDTSGQTELGGGSIVIHK